MDQLSQHAIYCPYCAEAINVLIDATDIDQQYIEDCQVCCRPINFLVTNSGDSELSVNVYSEDEAF